MNNRNEMSSISVDDFVFVDIIYCDEPEGGRGVRTEF